MLSEHKLTAPSVPAVTESKMVNLIEAVSSIQPAGPATVYKYFPSLAVNTKNCPFSLPAVCG